MARNTEHSSLRTQLLDSVYDTESRPRTQSEDPKKTASLYKTLGNLFVDGRSIALVDLAAEVLCYLFARASHHITCTRIFVSF